MAARLPTQAQRALTDIEVAVMKRMAAYLQLLVTDPNAYDRRMDLAAEADEAEAQLLDATRRFVAAHADPLAVAAHEYGSYPERAREVARESHRERRTWTDAEADSHLRAFGERMIEAVTS